MQSHVCSCLHSATVHAHAGAHVHMLWSCLYLHVCACTQCTGRPPVTLMWDHAFNHVYTNTHMHTYTQIYWYAHPCVSILQACPHTLMGAHAYICTPLQYMHILIHLYNFMSHTPLLAQACRRGEGLSEETQGSGFKSQLFPFLAVWLWVGRYLTLRASVFPSVQRGHGSQLRVLDN